MSFTTRTQLLGSWETAKGFLVKQLDSLYAQFGSLVSLAATVRTPYAKSALLATDQTGAAMFNRFPWIKVPFATSRFAQNTGTWTLDTPADQSSFRYLVVNGRMDLQVSVNSTTTDAGIGAELRVTLPDGWRAIASGYLGPCHWWYAAAAGSNGQGVVFSTATPNDHYLRLYPDPTRTTVWPISRTNDLEVYFNLTIPVYHPTLRPLVAGD